MRVRTPVVLSALIATGIVGPVAAEGPAGLDSPTARLSYALGMDLGSQLRERGVLVDPKVFARALADGLAGGETLMTPEEARREIGLLQAEMKRREAERLMQAQPQGGAPPGPVPGATLPAPKPAD